MRLIDQPTVFFIGESALVSPSPTPHPSGVRVGFPSYVKHVGSPDWSPSQGVTDAEAIPEIYGRICYRSWEAGLNANVTKVTDGTENYVQNSLIGKKHGSVLEHGKTNWIFADVSRVLTHELVRHRVGVAISQESLRYVRLTDIPFRLPPDYREDATVVEVMGSAVRGMEEYVRDLVEHFNLDALPMNEKKKLTSLIRRIAPMGLATTIGWSPNFRTLRWVIEQRTSRYAEEEVRYVFGQVAAFAVERWPAVFKDFECVPVDGLMEWTTPNSKV